MSDDEFFGALPIGYRLEEYQIESILGQGGFGITYKARDTNLNKLVAIKEYLPEQFALRKRTDTVSPRQGSRDDFQWGLERFLQEAQTLGQFEHPNIVPVLRYFEANSTAYMVMAYQDGQALGDILDSVQILEETELEEIIYPLLDGLEAVHRSGVLHRDIKPDNIFIRLADGTPVLLDFGAARQAIGARHRNVTRIVTPNYAPHEQYHSDGELGPWTDIYALAAVVYEGITGAPPPEAPARITNDKIVPATRAGRDRYRRGFLQAIDAGLAVRHERRPQTIADWRKKFPPPLNPEISVSPSRFGRLSTALRPGSARLAAAAARSRRLSAGESPTTRDPAALVSAALADFGGAPTEVLTSGVPTAARGAAHSIVPTSSPGMSPVASPAASPAASPVGESSSAGPATAERPPLGAGSAPPAPPAPRLPGADGLPAAQIAETGGFGGRPTQVLPLSEPDGGSATLATPPRPSAAYRDAAYGDTARRQTAVRRRRPALVWVATAAVVFIVAGFGAVAVTLMGDSDSGADRVADGGSTTSAPLRPADGGMAKGGSGGETAADGAVAGRDDTDPDPGSSIDVAAVVRDLEEQDKLLRRQRAAAIARWRRQRAAAEAKARDKAVAKAFRNRRLTARLPGRGDSTLLRFAANGRLSASTVSLNGSGDIDENGRWWIKNERLCMKLQRWNGGATSCFKVTFRGRPTSRRVGVAAASGSGSFNGTLTY